MDRSSPGARVAWAGGSSKAAAVGPCCPASRGPAARCRCCSTDAGWPVPGAWARDRWPPGGGGVAGSKWRGGAVCGTPTRWGPMVWWTAALCDLGKDIGRLTGQGTGTRVLGTSPAERAAVPCGTLLRHVSQSNERGPPRATGTPTGRVLRGPRAPPDPGPREVCQPERASIQDQSGGR
jgi:hypothetical protein